MAAETVVGRPEHADGPSHDLGRWEGIISFPRSCVGMPSRPLCGPGDAERRTRTFPRRAWEREFPWRQEDARPWQKNERIPLCALCVLCGESLLIGCDSAAP